MSQRNIFYYDNRDNLSCVRDPDLGLTYYTYDGLSRMTSVKNPHGEVTYYEYTPGGQVKQKILGNGAVSYYSYDAARRVSRIEHRKSDLTEIATLDYEYDRVGNPTKITREDGSATYYDYDDIYQLTGETQVGSGGGVEYAFEYDYDGAHNRTVKVVDGVPTYYTYNAANELLTETTEGETTYYHYDGRGNTVAKQEPSGTTYYRYNTENLMTRIDFAAGGSSYYDYDADSKRVSQRTADGFRKFVYQGPDMLKLQMERDESEETVAHYTMGAGLEAMRRETSSFYHYNHLGTALALTGADEAVSDTYRHDAWGVLLERTGSTVNPHTYVGRERYYRMPHAEMYHLGFRDYAQGVGRFTTVDPLPGAGGSLARYDYSRNTPMRMLDPRGLQPWEWDPDKGKYRWEIEDPERRRGLPPIESPPVTQPPIDYPGIVDRIARGAPAVIKSALTWLLQRVWSHVDVEFQFFMGIVGGGLVHCCDENCQWRVARYFKACYGVASIGLSFSAGPAIRPSGKGCPDRYAGRFFEVGYGGVEGFISVPPEHASIGDWWNYYRDIENWLLGWGFGGGPAFPVSFKAMFCNYAVEQNAPALGPCIP